MTTVEKDRQHYMFIRAVLHELNDDAANLLQGDALKFIERCRQPFELVFADPPYILPELPELPERVLKSDCLKAGGLFILEHGKNYNFSHLPEFLEHRAYGSVNFSFFRKPETAE